MEIMWSGSQVVDAHGRSNGRALALDLRVQLPGMKDVAVLKPEHVEIDLSVKGTFSNQHAIQLPAP